MPRQPLDVAKTEHVEFVHINMKRLRDTFKQQPPQMLTAGLAVDDQRGVYRSRFSLQPTFTPTDLANPLLQSPLIARAMQMPRSEQGGELSAVFLACHGDSQLIHYVPRIQREIPSFDRQCFFDTEEMEDCFDIHTFEVGTLMPTVVFSIKNPLATLSAQEHQVLNVLLEKYWRNDQLIQGLIPSDGSTDIHVIRLAAEILLRYDTIIVKDNTVQTVRNICLAVAQLALDGVLLTINDEIFYQALKLANTYAAQELALNGAEEVLTRLESCKADFTVGQIQQVSALASSLRGDAKSQPWVVVEQFQRFAKTIKEPGIWGIFYTSSTTAFKQLIESLQSCIAIAGFNVSLGENQARRERARGMIDLKKAPGSLHGAALAPSGQGATDDEAGSDDTEELESASPESEGPVTLSYGEDASSTRP